ncbi:MAG: geranylgeranyl reductase family protein [Candidatus Eisenbacteria bacterium]|nr:geranylgeranyl reductase family protein [Candidatus Eisenbacteria bacterium]
MERRDRSVRRCRRGPLDGGDPDPVRGDRPRRAAPGLGGAQLSEKAARRLAAGRLAGADRLRPAHFRPASLRPRLAGAASVKNRCDLIVIGGGPAGASCAERAARLGLSVALLERARFPRPKPCAAGISVRAMPVLGELPGELVHARPGIGEIVLSNDTELIWRGGVPAVLTTTRAELDLHLLDRARRAGAHVVEGAAARIRDATGSCVVEAGGDRWSAPWIVAADGAAGGSRAALGIDPLRVAGAVYVRVLLDASRLESHHNRAIFDLRAVRSGYGWVFPKRDHLSVGVYQRRPVGRRLRAALTGFLREWGFGDDPLEGPFASPVPLRAGPFGSERVLLAGDAAGLADPITGEGIPHAVESGRAAAECVASALASGEDALADYRNGIRRGALSRVNEFRFLGRLVYAVGSEFIGRVLMTPVMRGLAGRIAPSFSTNTCEELHVRRTGARRSR